jgi:hypothetical protein
MRKSSVRGIAVSPFWLLKTKKPPSLAVSGILRRTCSAKSVNLPLFHRQMAGMAKVKIAGKDKRAAHGILVVQMTIPPMRAAWQALPGARGH